MEQRLIIHSYRKLWKFDRKIYAIGNVKMPVPIAINSAGYLLIGVGVMWLLNKLPIMATIPWILKWAAFPYGVMKLLDTVKLDGKNPFMYMIGCTRFWLMEKNGMVEHFHMSDATQREVSLCWQAGTPWCCTRYVQAIKIWWIAGKERCT